MKGSSFFAARLGWRLRWQGCQCATLLQVLRELDVFEDAEGFEPEFSFESVPMAEAAASEASSFRKPFSSRRRFLRRSSISTFQFTTPQVSSTSSTGIRCNGSSADRRLP